MTLRHIVLMKLADGPDAGFIAEMHAAVRDMAKTIPEVIADRSGVDVSENPDNYHYAFIFDFADAAAYERYRVHPAHQGFIQRYMRGRSIEKVRIQLAIDE